VTIRTVGGAIQVLVPLPTQREFTP